MPRSALPGGSPTGDPWRSLGMHDVPLGNPECPSDLVRSPQVHHGKTHELKSDPTSFAEVARGTRRFEYRPADRHFEIGDVLLLREWRQEKFTGRGTRVRVTSIMYVDLGYVIMSIEPIYNAPMMCPCCGSEWQCPRCPLPEQLMSVCPCDEELEARDAWRGNLLGQGVVKP